tara:strand:- start:10075 stop:10701 length:627 start_codon:yes stop_codon:yes gene_type:complete
MTDRQPTDMPVDLDSTLNLALELLSNAVDERAAPFRTPVVASISEDGEGRPIPDSRIMVLRSFRASDRRITLFSDIRSAKIDQIKAYPTISVLFYDPAKRLQIRLAGRCEVHRADRLSEVSWQSLSSTNKRSYSIQPSPGTWLPQATAYNLSPKSEHGPASSSDASNFCVLETRYNRLEWLYLAPQGHRRALFTWDSAAVADAHWLAP